MFKALTSTIFVAPQISVEAIAQAKNEGVTLVVNNRPDGESPDQVPGAEIEAAARAAGMDYVAIPVTHSGFAPWQLDALDEALAGNEALNEGGKVLCYCRSGMRSTLLWSLARARAGDNPDEITEIAAAAGYNVTPVAEMMHALAGGER